MFQLVAALLIFVSCISPAALAVTLTSDQAQNSALPLPAPQETGKRLTRPTMLLLPGGGKGKHLLSVTATNATQLADSTLRNGPKAMGADLSAFAPLSDSLAPLSDSLNPRRLLPGSGPGKRGDIKGKHLLSAHESAHESAHQSTHESALLRGTLQHPKGLTVGPIARQVDSPAQAVHVGAVFKLAAGRMLPGGGKGKHLLSTAPTTLSTSSGAIHQTAGTGHHQQDGLVLSAGRMLPGGGKGKHMLSTAATTLSTASDGSHQAAIAGHHQQDSLVLSAGRMLPGGGKGKHLLASLALSPTASGGSQQTAAQLTGTAAQHQQQDSSAQSVVMTAGRMLPGGGKGRLLLSVVAPKNAIV